mmetsp:Transcript_23367/g.48544  ORF Transcript_23367/g.48544 Transcript_23367/m.48544 type:complete len:271 (+) Transcript_23367:174-986(+)
MMCVAILSRKYLSWETTRAQPPKSRRASSRDRMVSLSRSLVGSSRMRKLPPDLTILASRHLFRSPPLRSFTLLCCRLDLSPNQEQYALEDTLCVPSSISSRPSLISSKALLSPFRPSIRSCPTATMFTVCPTSRFPESGLSEPVIMFTRVVFPAPLGPTTPTMDPGGRSKLTSLSSTFSPKALLTPLAETTTSPSLGPGGMYMEPLELSSLGAAALASSSYLLSLALLLLPLAFGVDLIHSSSADRALAVALSCCFSLSRRFAFSSSHLE